MFDIARSILAFVVEIGVLIFIHELGHYFAARSQHVTVETFSLGFGPVLLKYKAKKSGTIWQICALPLGGYVKMQGWGEEPTRGPAAPGSFASASLASKAMIVAAGPLANLLLAVVLYAGLFMTAGRVVLQPVLDQIEPGSPAAMAHLQAGDRVLAIGGTKISNFTEMQSIIAASPNRELDFTIQRAGADFTRPVSIGATNFDGGRIGHLGVATTTSTLTRLAPGPAVVAAFREVGEQIRAWYMGLKMLILKHQGIKDLAGPIGIAQITGKVAAMGFVPVIMLTALLSINLGLVNLIPIPILDGGHLLFYLLEFISGRPVPDRFREHGLRLGLGLILGLMLLVTFDDLTRLGVVSWITKLL